MSGGSYLGGGRTLPGTPLGHCLISSEDFHDLSEATLADQGLDSAYEV